MIEHPKFTILALLSLIFILFIVGLYDYNVIIYPNKINIRFGLKPVPLSILIANVLFYFIIYRVHIYALLIGISFLFCLIGDILLMFYIPPIEEYNNVLFLIFGGISFFIARVIMSLSYGIYPFKNNKEQCIDMNIKKIVLFGVVIFIWTMSMCIYFPLNMNSDTIMKILIPMYFIVMGVNLSMSLFRIKGFEEETLRSQLFAVVGTVLFTASDNLLFWNLFIYEIPYGDIISITLYWIGMYFIMISIVRTASVLDEKHITNVYLPIRNNKC
jgi:hypothetical protein